MNEYKIIVKGEQVGTYKSDLQYHEFAAPFFIEHPELKEIITWFDHVNMYIADRDMTEYPKYSVSKNGTLLEHTYVSINFSVQKIN